MNSANLRERSSSRFPFINRILDRLSRSAILRWPRAGAEVTRCSGAGLRLKARLRIGGFRVGRRAEPAPQAVDPGASDRPQDRFVATEGTATRGGAV